MADPPVITRLRPVAIAHRAANDLAALRTAEDAGYDLLECDIWPYRGRMEVRHAKTLGNTPVPVLWDREGWRHWQLAPGWRPRLQLSTLLAAQSEASELMLDLKGTDQRLPGAVLAAIERHARSRPFTVCSQNWALLRPFAGRDSIAVVHSIGNERQLRRLDSEEARAVSIHQGLLTPERVASLKRRVRFVMTWHITTRERAEELLAWGVDGIISSHPDVLEHVIAARR